MSISFTKKSYRTHSDLSPGSYCARQRCQAPYISIDERTIMILLAIYEDVAVLWSDTPSFDLGPSSTSIDQPFLTDQLIAIITTRINVSCPHSWSHRLNWVSASWLSATFRPNTRSTAWRIEEHKPSSSLVQKSSPSLTLSRILMTIWDLQAAK